MLEILNLDMLTHHFGDDRGKKKASSPYASKASWLPPSMGLMQNKPKQKNKKEGGYHEE